MKKNSSSISPLYVHIDRPDGCKLVGSLSVRNDDPLIQDGFSASFQYNQDWLSSGFPIDPINLPLTPGITQTNSKYIKLGSIFDAAPDLWGRRVIDSSADFSSSDERKVLLMGRGNGVGSLLFSDSPGLSRQDLPSFESLPLIEKDLPSLHEAVHQVCLKTEGIHSEAMHWLAGSWSMGGARAKAVVRDRNNKIYIAKFSEPADKFDRQRIEHANLLMAQDIGINTPKSSVIDTPLGSVFLIERFDRTGSLERKHFLSAISLASAEPESKRFESARDQMMFSYARIAKIAAKVSTTPTEDILDLYARMILNVCVKNTDDHMKNTAFIESAAGNGSIQLSPVFDVVTQPGESLHYLRIGKEGRVGSIANALSEPERFGIKHQMAKKIADRVIDVVSERDFYYEKVGLNSKDLADINNLLDKRCARSKHEQSFTREK